MTVTKIVDAQLESDLRQATEQIYLNRKVSKANEARLEEMSPALAEAGLRIEAQETKIRMLNQQNAELQQTLALIRSELFQLKEAQTSMDVDIGRLFESKSE